MFSVSPVFPICYAQSASTRIFPACEPAGRPWEVKVQREDLGLQRTAGLAPQMTFFCIVVDYTSMGAGQVDEEAHYAGWLISFAWVPGHRCEDGGQRSHRGLLL